MPDTDERLLKALEHIKLTEGFMTDAEFREDHETRVIRYLQALTNGLLALSLQNQVIIELLEKQSKYGALSRE